MQTQTLKEQRQARSEDRDAGKGKADKNSRRDRGDHEAPDILKVFDEFFGQKSRPDE